jgi:hypothetical protein
MTELGMTEATLALTKECLKSKKRSPSLLLFARYLRGKAYETAGKASLARKEFEKIYAENAHFADVAERLGKSKPIVLPPPP